MKRLPILDCLCGNLTRSEDDIQFSIIQEVSDILNTRSNLFWENYIFEDESYHFGMPNINGEDQLNKNNMNLVEETIEKILEKFEPRLINPEVKIISYNKEKFMLLLSISGETKIYDKIALMKFELESKIERNVL